MILAMTPLERDMKPVAAGGPNDETVITDLSRKLPNDVAGTATDNADCFRDLALADKAKLDRCATVVYQTLIDVEQYAALPKVREHLKAGDKRRIAEQLQLAASEVCRIKWAKNPVDELTFESPACAAAQVQLASDIP
jgi:hypothetical protein